MTAAPEAPAKIPVFGTVRGGWRLVYGFPRPILLPVAAIHVPVSIILAFVTLVSSLTVLRDEPIDPFESGATKTLFLFLSTLGAWLLFSHVARAAAIRAVAGVARQQRPTLTDSLDPAFTRMGGIVALAIALLAAAALIAVPFIGWLLGPYLYLRLSLSLEAYMLDEPSPLRALRRSWEVTRGRMLRLLGVVALASLTLLGPFIILSLLSLGVTGGRTQQVITSAGYSIVQGVLIIPVVAFITAVTTAFYLQATGDFDVERDV